LKIERHFVQHHVYGMILPMAYNNYFHTTFDQVEAYLRVTREKNPPNFWWTLSGDRWRGLSGCAGGMDSLCTKKSDYTVRQEMVNFLDLRSFISGLKCVVVHFFVGRCLACGCVELDRKRKSSYWKWRIPSYHGRC